MNLTFIAEVWEALRPSIGFDDRSEAADVLVNLLIDNDYEPSDIKSAFRGDEDVNRALKYYNDHNQDEEEEEDWDYDDSEDDEY